MTTLQSYLLCHALATMALFAFGFLFKRHLKYGSHIHWWTTAGFAVGGAVGPLVPPEYLLNGAKGYAWPGWIVGWFAAWIHVAVVEAIKSKSLKSEPEA